MIDPARPSRGGMVLRVAPGEGGLRFLTATTALRVAPSPPIVRVPGAPPELVGIATHEGDVLPVVSLGEDRSAMVVCSIGGELVGLVGGSVLATGLFEACSDDDDRGAVVHDGIRVPTLDLAGIVGRLHRARTGRWGG